MKKEEHVRKGQKRTKKTRKKEKGERQEKVRNIWIKYENYKKIRENIYQQEVAEKVSIKGAFLRKCKKNI